MFAKICVLVLTMCCWSLSILGSGINRPNIVIVLADDLGCDDVSYHGSKLFLTPNIDALGYHGKILDRLYVPPMCTPSRAALLTGQYPIHTGTQHLVIFNEQNGGILSNFTNMATIFQSQGYSTNLIGKWHLGMGRKEYTPTFNGFDHHYGYWGGFIDYFKRISKMPSNASVGYDFRRNMDLECAPEGSYVTDLLTEEAENVIMKHSKQQPLFLLVTHLAPHTANEVEPLQAPQEEITKFNYIPDINKRTYAAMVSKLDESVGRIVKALDKRDMLKNSIILFYSDNGAPSKGIFSNTGSNWPLRGQKYSPWEGALRVPAVIWSPLMKNKRSIYQSAIYVGDFLPTLAAAAKIPLGPFKLNLDGLNLWNDLAVSPKNSYLNTHKTREIVHVLDDIDQVQSYMEGEFKYIKGTTNQGSFDHVLSTRNASIIDPREQNYEEVILNSLVSKSLQKYDDLPLTSVEITNLRREAAIKCTNLESSCNPLKEDCLFNIFLDPCENNNLAKNPFYKPILNKFTNRLEQLRKTAISPRNGDTSAEYDPMRHHCIWTNFLDEKPTEDTMECDYNPSICQKARFCFI